MKYYSWTILALLMAALNTSHQKKTRLWLIGDSTISIKDPKAYPETGWGMPFVHYWDSTIEVMNLAMNGRSTRTFLEEKRWEPVMAGLQPGDYVFIQFGHNDEGVTKKSYVPQNEYRMYLEKYVSDVKSLHGIPILITPVSRRRFDSTGHAIHTHAAYSAIVRELAREKKVILFDLDEQSRLLFDSLGPDGSAWLFNHLKPAQHPNYPDGKNDDTHFNEAGALKIAGLVLADIRIQVPELARHLIQKSPVK